MNPTLNGSFMVQRLEGRDVLEIHDGITFDFYTGLPHTYLFLELICCHSSQIENSAWGT